jgi:VanZ family protein
MPAMGAIANGDARSMEPIFIGARSNNGNLATTEDTEDTENQCTEQRLSSASTVSSVVESSGRPVYHGSRMPRKSFFYRLWLWGPPLVYMVLIFHLSSESNPLPELTENVWDKALHTIEYGTLGLLLCRAFAGEGLPLALAGFCALAATSLYGGSDEWHQLFTPGRSSDIHDWFADTTGGLLGIVGYAVLFAHAARPHRRRAT